MAMRSNIRDLKPVMKWGDWDKGVEAEFAVYEAEKQLALAKHHLEKIRRVYASSSHRASSGQTSEIQGKEGRKGRQAHKTRKAIHEAAKEMKRRAKWNAEFGNKEEAMWALEEGRRKERKTRARSARRSRKR